MKTKVFVLVAVAVGVLVFGGGVAMATVAVGFHPTILSQGRIAKPAEISKNGIEFSTRGQTDVLVQSVTLDAATATTPAGNSGWHMHPGLYCGKVKLGTVTFHSGCHSKSYSANQSFGRAADDAGFRREHRQHRCGRRRVSDRSRRIPRPYSRDEYVSSRLQAP